MGNTPKRRVTSSETLPAAATAVYRRACSWSPALIGGLRPYRRPSITCSVPPTVSHGRSGSVATEQVEARGGPFHQAGRRAAHITCFVCDHRPMGKGGLDVPATRAPWEGASARRCPSHGKQSGIIGRHSGHFTADDGALFIVESVNGSEIQDEPEAGADAGSVQRRDVAVNDVRLDPGILCPPTRGANRLCNEINTGDLPAPNRKLD